MVCTYTVCDAGESDIPGLTDDMKAKMRGPKRASKIRKLYNLSKGDDVRQAAKLHARKIEKDGKSILKVPKIQRLVTPATLQRKRRRAAMKKRAIEKVRRHRLPVSCVHTTHSCVRGGT
jgi:small subunit ribosomal protein S6e